MRHQKTRHKLSRSAAHRKALLANLCKEVIQHERIKTTEAKAKAVKPELEQLITLAKRGDLHARRQALSALGQDKFTVHKLFEEVAPRYAERPGGYTRILKLGPRRSRRDRDGLPRAGLRRAAALAAHEYEILDERFGRLRAARARASRSSSTAAAGPRARPTSPAGRYLVWSDIPNDRMLRWDETTGAVGVFRAAGGLHQRPHGRPRRAGS